jgi:hypothetical protein
MLGVLDSGKCVLQTESLKNSSKLIPQLGAFRKIVKSGYYLHHVCPSVCTLEMTQLLLGVFSVIYFLNPLKKNQVLLNSDKNNSYFT